jgi:hypothetical protein
MKVSRGFVSTPDRAAIAGAASAAFQLWAETLLTHSDSISPDTEWLMSPRLRMPTIRLLLLITGSLRSRQLLHAMHRLCKVIVLPAAMDAFGHHIARRRAARIEVVAREPFADDVAVGHYSDQSVVLPNRNAADVKRPHHFR